MNHHFRDIRDRIAEDPKWWDENATPRYCEFKPDETAFIYADECVLFEVACQDCNTRFLVCRSSAYWKRELRRMESTEKQYSIKEVIDEGLLHYGDPPNTGCCPAGPSMSSEFIRVVEYWRKDKDKWEWVREI